MTILRRVYWQWHSCIDTLARDAVTGQIAPTLSEFQHIILLPMKSMIISLNADLKRQHSQSLLSACTALMQILEPFFSIPALEKNNLDHHHITCRCKAWKCGRSWPPSCSRKAYGCLSPSSLWAATCSRRGLTPQHIPHWLSEGCGGEV